MSQDFGYDVSAPVGGSDIAQYTLVKTPTGLVVSAAATDDCFGVLQDGVLASAGVSNVRIFGVTRVRAEDGAIIVGQALVPAAAGRANGHDGTSANPIIGFALEASNAQDDEILAFIGTPGMFAGFAA